MSKEEYSTSKEKRKVNYYVWKNKHYFIWQFLAVFFIKQKVPGMTFEGILKSKLNLMYSEKVSGLVESTK